MRATIRPFRTRFRYGSTYWLSLATYIKSPNHDAKGTPSHLPCGVALELLVNMWFQVLLIPLTGVLFTFPSRYLFTIGCQGVFSLIPWSGQIHAEFHLHRITWDSSRGLGTSLTRLSRSLADFSKSLSSLFTSLCRGPSTPERQVLPV